LSERPRLLVVDDDLELCESMADALTDAGDDTVGEGHSRRRHDRQP
jgi:DNA-binding response OmpR family regulator